MDPDELLKAIRVLLNARGPAPEIVTAGQESVLAYWRDLFNQLADNVADLDQWLKTGGFLPDEWQRARE